MKLFLILYTAQGIGGVWGPLPYDMNECEKRAQALQAEVDQVADTGIGKGGVQVPASAREAFGQWTVACEYRASMPALGSQ